MRFSPRFLDCNYDSLISNYHYSENQCILWQPSTMGLQSHLRNCLACEQLGIRHAASAPWYAQAVERRKTSVLWNTLLSTPISVVFCYAYATLIEVALMTKVKCGTLCKSGRHKSPESVPNQESPYPDTNADSMKMWILEASYECIKWKKTKCNYDYWSGIYFLFTIPL